MIFQKKMLTIFLKCLEFLFFVANVTKTVVQLSGTIFSSGLIQVSKAPFTAGGGYTLSD